MDNLERRRIEVRKSWVNNLSNDDRYEWLCNCYQLRCDDDYAYGGCSLHGPYDPDACPMSVTIDFRQFCILALWAKVLPNDWDWEKFLSRAGTDVPSAFEKADVEERWGKKMSNQLQFTAFCIYDRTVQDDGQTEKENMASELAYYPSDEVLDQIGGRAGWILFGRSLIASDRFQKSSPSLVSAEDVDEYFQFLNA